VGAAGGAAGKTDAGDLLAAIEKRYRATVCFTAPTFYRQMAPLAASFDLASLQKRVGRRGAAAGHARGWRQATGCDDRRHRRHRTAAHLHFRQPATEVRPGATGKPVPGYQACILDARAPVGPGVIGRLAVKGRPAAATWPTNASATMC
jgi:2-aminobenzoate-CoA ligase